MDTRPRIRYFFYDIYVASNQMLRPEASGDNGNSRRELVPAEQRATPLISCICRCTLFQGTPRPSLLPLQINYQRFEDAEEMEEVTDSGHRFGVHVSD
ncbi:hypothetical protein V6N11_011863 [Hibiscus sabdariffa]|uniref:Uncharacterized protein n=1 Tax=Hibiscus sabdariffa TaxID=183260 RepID=A0ABR2S9J0_9ROSI